MPIGDVTVYEWSRDASQRVPGKGDVEGLREREKSDRNSDY